MRASLSAILAVGKDQYAAVRRINNAGQILAETWETPVLLTPFGPGPSDINGDCRTDVDDLMILLYEWGEDHSPADVNGDGTVDVDDLLLMMAAWS